MITFFSIVIHRAHFPFSPFLPPSFTKSPTRTSRRQEEAYLREAIKASLEEQKHNEGKTPEKPKISAEAADLLIDFMDDWDAAR